MTAATVLRERQVRGGKRSVPLRGDRKGPASAPWPQRLLLFLGWVWPPVLSPGPQGCRADCWGHPLHPPVGWMGQRPPGVSPSSPFLLRKTISAAGQGMHGWLLVPLFMLIKPRSTPPAF